jgi:NADH-quinone oxidoreductase subunit F
MDLHIEGAEPTGEERAAVDGLLGPPASGWTGGVRDIASEGRTAAGGRTVSGQRHLLLPALHAVQDRIGWISRGALNYICRRLTVPPAEAWGVVTFYDLLATEPRPRVVVHVCDDIACRLDGAQALCRDLSERVGPAANRPHGHVPVPTGHHPGAGASPGPIWFRSPCLGQCDKGSAALVTRAGAAVERFTIAPVGGADALARVLEQGSAPPAAPDRLGVPPRPRLLARAREGPGALTLADYRARGGYLALARAIELGPERVIAEVAASKLLGRGGAAFPTGRKWDAVRRQTATPHYVVCNADESEPGTFKDRVVMERDPFAVVETMTICGLATASEKGFIYIRGEYPLAESRIASAIGEARGAGLLGPSVMGSGSAFDIEIRRGGGAYICGEETALFNSIEGKRGEPRSKPPFPAEVGVFGKPTVANNVETLVNVIDILLEGGEAWAAIGTSGSSGPRLFCVSGHVERPGLYEVEFGATLGQVIDLAGGVRGGRPAKAVLLGGAAGGFVGPDRLDMPLTFEAARAAGTTLGSGVVMVYDDSADVADSLARIAEFFRHESCGQCVPCRVGTVRQVELLPALAIASPGDSAIDAAARALGEAGMPPVAAMIAPSSVPVAHTYAELAIAMRDASICGLGQTASSAIESALALNLLGERPR